MRSLFFVSATLLAVTAVALAAPASRSYHFTTTTEREGEGENHSSSPSSSGSLPSTRALVPSEPPKSIELDVPLDPGTETLEVHADVTSSIGAGSVVLGVQSESPDNMTTGVDVSSGTGVLTVGTPTWDVDSVLGGVTFKMDVAPMLLVAAAMGAALLVVLGSSITSLVYMRRMSGRLDGISAEFEKIKGDVTRVVAFSERTALGPPSASPYSHHALNTPPLSPLKACSIQSPLEDGLPSWLARKTSSNWCSKSEFTLPQGVAL